MADKLIHEIRVIETEDGFRIEVKGDKERLRAMGFGSGMGFGPFSRFWRHYGRRGFRKHGHGPGFAPWDWRWWEDDPKSGGESGEEGVDL